MKRFSPENVFSNEHTVYKVVDSQLGSCLASGQYYVHYRLGEFVTAPEGTKFFVFESLQHAYQFRHRDTDLQIWRATARGVYAPAARIGDPKHSIDILDFWQTTNRGRSYGALAGRRTPPGTLWADAIRLDECISYHPFDADRAPSSPAQPIFQARLRG